jgi:hypothetical protein
MEIVKVCDSIKSKVKDLCVYNPLKDELKQQVVVAENNKVSTKVTSSNKVYPIDGSWKDKVLYISTVLHDGFTTNDIADRMSKYEPTYSRDNLLTKIQTICSQLCLKDGKFKNINTNGWQKKYILVNGNSNKQTTTNPV